LPFGLVQAGSNSQEIRHRCVRVSAKLAAICNFSRREGFRENDNQIAHRMQCFSHLLN
jgi:hypothetical protein